MVQKKPKKKVVKKKVENAKYVNVHEDKPLTHKENLFVNLLVSGKRTGVQAIQGAGFSCTPSSAASKAYHLSKLKPNTRKAIKDLKAKLYERLEFDAFDHLQRVQRVAMADPANLAYYNSDGKVIVTVNNEHGPNAKALFAGIKERVNEKGYRTIEIKTHDQMAAHKMMFDYFGLREKSRKAKQEPVAEQQQALRDIKSGEKTILEVCCDLEIAGIPLPDTLRIMLSKNVESDDNGDGGDSIMPTAEEMAEKRKKKLDEIDGQRTDFLPKRQEEVRELKSKMSKKDQFKDDKKS